MDVRVDCAIVHGLLTDLWPGEHTVIRPNTHSSDRVYERKPTSVSAPSDDFCRLRTSQSPSAAQRDKHLSFVKRSDRAQSARDAESQYCTMAPFSGRSQS